MSFLWRIDRDAARGRMLRTTRAVRAGECVLRDQPYGLVVLNESRVALCAVCLRAADPDICCDDCSKVFFCSEKCREKLQDVHEDECMALEDVELVASKTSVEVDLLRLLIRVLAAKAHDAVDGELTTNDAGSVVTTYANVRELVHAVDQHSEAWIKHVREGAAKILEDLPSKCRLPIDDILELAAQINENSYSLGALNDLHLVASVGLFPIMGLINHSCSPNCGWANAGDGSAATIALRDLEEGEEITVSYIDNDKERQERRQELLETKHFSCACERCIQPLSESVDRFLEGLLCPRCPAQEEPLLLTVQDKAKCPKCEVEFSLASVQEAVRGAREAVKSAKQLLAQAQYQAVVAKLGGPAQTISVGGVQIAFHSSHAIVIVAMRVLTEAHAKLGDVEQALKARKQLVRSLERVSDRFHLPLAIAHLDYADAIRRVTLRASTPLPEHLDQESLLLDMRSSYREFKVICDVCLPEVHPLRQMASAAVSH